MSFMEFVELKKLVEYYLKYIYIYTYSSTNPRVLHLLTHTFGVSGYKLIQICYFIFLSSIVISSLTKLIPVNGLEAQNTFYLVLQAHRWHVAPGDIHLKLSSRRII